MFNMSVLSFDNKITKYLKDSYVLDLSIIYKNINIVIKRFNFYSFIVNHMIRKIVLLFFNDFYI